MDLVLEIARILLPLAIVGGIAVFVIKGMYSKKEYMIPIILTFGSMALLYLVGFIFDIDFLIFKITPSKSEVALLPIIIGLLIAFIGDKIVDSKSKKREN